METPTSDFESNGDIESSEPSTPGTPIKPFQPLYSVKVTDPIKDGENVKYTIKTVKEADPGLEYSVVRVYDDFEWLHHCICTQNDINGQVVPPLPPKPTVEAKSAEKQSKKQLGNSSKVILGDEYQRDCRSLEVYLKLMVDHHVLGRDETLKQFLTDKQEITKTKVKKGIFGKISSAVEEARKASHRDIDDFFQKERDTANDNAACIREALTDFNKMLYAQQRIAGAYAHLSTALNLGGGIQEDNLIKANKLFIRLSEAIDDAKHGADVDNANDENTLGFQLDLYTRYSEAVKEMLFRRTCLLIEYEDANKALDKAKPQKRQAAEDAKVTAEKAFEECSEIARRELTTYQRQRLLAFQKALSTHAEAKIKTARDTYALLVKSLSGIKQMQL